jgi:hypothetical protein
MNRVQRRLLALAWAAVLGGCEQHTRIQGAVLQTAKDPTGTFTAWATRSDAGGATVPFVYHVYIKGRSDAEPDEVLRATDADLRLAWSGPGALTVEIGCGRVFQFTSFYDSMSKGELVARARVRLVQAQDCPEH